MVRPEDAGIGLAPQSAANAPLAVEALDVLAGGDEQLPRVAGRDSQQLGCARRGARDERLELLIELGDLAVELLDAERE